ncbi:MAG: hypothetical protein AVO33_00350 [delta proteobacterium ML8_F1]|nr:MAG: hypothetical protein AVO33_00350 [delta proteobacterium ML8_F1]
MNGKRIAGIDFLRGLCIFVVLILHTSFYSFEGIFDVDFDNPPVIITIIGLLLMFAGIFAMISGFSHTTQILSRMNQGHDMKAIFRHLLVAALYLLVLGFLQKTVLGSGHIDFDSRSFNNTIAVEWIKSGRLVLPGLDRLLYINSLTMMGLNILLLGLLFKIIETIKERINVPLTLYLLAILYFFLSLVRMPLYDTFLIALNEGNYGLVLVLNIFVNKNNPVLPYFAFALFGAWIAALKHYETRKASLYVLVNGSAFLLIGAYLYVNLPDTMLDRAIDLKWFSIMGAQIGLFMLMLLAVLNMEQTEKGVRKFITRFGIAGLTPYLMEAAVNASLLRMAQILIPGFHLSMTFSLVYGILTAFVYGIFLVRWEKSGYRYGVEDLYVHLFKEIKSEKENKMKAA